MNQRYVRKLHKDLKKYSKQIGISQKYMPELATDKYRLRDAIMERTGDPSFSTKMYYRYKNKAGSCFYGLEIIYVNTHQRYLVNTQKEKVLTYKHFLLGLIHELIHYRFENELEHGLELITENGDNSGKNLSTNENKRGSRKRKGSRVK